MSSLYELFFSSIFTHLTTYQMDLTWQAINHCYLTPKSTPSLLITCLIAFLLAFGLEHLRLVQRKYDRKLVSKYAHSHTQKTKWDSARDGEGTYELLDQVDEKEDELRSEIEKEVRPVRRRVVLEQCLRGVIQMFVFGIGLVVMIVFMYGNSTLSLLPTTCSLREEEKLIDLCL